MLPSWAKDTVIVVRAATVADRYGNQVRDWATASRTDVPGCSVQPLDMAEQVSPDRDAVTTRWRLFAPAGVDVAATDRISWGGVDYEVDGDPQRWQSPTGGLAHLEVVLRRVEG